MQQQIIRVGGVKKHYGDVEVLKGVDLTVNAGQFTAIMGKSGSGKSTLLGIIAGLEKPDEGKVVVMGQNLAGMSDNDMADAATALDRHRVSGLQPDPVAHRARQCAAADFLRGGNERSRAPPARRRSAEAGGLGERLNYHPATLSGGEQQRVAIARALMNSPSILLADEPTGNLDQETGASVLELLLDLGRTHGTGLLMVTHDPDVAAKAGHVVE